MTKQHRVVRLVRRIRFGPGRSVVIERTSGRSRRVERAKARRSR